MPNLKSFPWMKSWEVEETVSWKFSLEDDVSNDDTDCKESLLCWPLKKFEDSEEIGLDSSSDTIVDLTEEVATFRNGTLQSQSFLCVSKTSFYTFQLEFHRKIQNCVLMLILNTKPILLLALPGNQSCIFWFKIYHYSCLSRKILTPLKTIYSEL